MTVGGGVEPSERSEDAAVRELYEETGIKIDPAQLVGPFHRAEHAFSYAGMNYLSDSLFYAVAVDDVSVTLDGLEAEEVGNVIEARWWAPVDLVAGMTSSNLDLPTIARAAVIALRRLLESADDRPAES